MHNFILLMLVWHSFVHATEPPATAADLDLFRRRVWAAKCGPADDKTWDVCFEGAGIPGEDARPHLYWDNPIDDDWELAAARQSSLLYDRFDGTTSFFRVNRAIEPFRVEKTGHFWRRDEFLTRASGLESVFKVRALGGNGDQGAGFHFFDDKDKFTVFIDRTRVLFFDTLPSNFSTPPTAIAVTTNTSWSEFKILKPAGSNQVLVYKKTSSGSWTRLFGTSTLTAGSSTNLIQPITADSGRFTSRLGFGDMNYTYEGAFDLAHLRYRRPGAATRPAPALPAIQTCATQPWKQVLAGGIDPDEGNFPKYKILNPGVNSFTDPDDGQFGRSIEFDLKLSPTTGINDAFSVYYADLLGAISLSVYPGRIELAQGGKPVAPVAYSPAGFDGYQLNKIRIVRMGAGAGKGLYWYAYLNGQSLPVHFDVRASGFSRTPYIKIGSFRPANLNDLVPGVDSSIQPLSNAVAEVNYMKWMNFGLAPNPGCS